MLMRFFAALLLLGLTEGGTELPPSKAFYGVITQIQGPVEAVGPGTGELPLASPWQVIQMGVRVYVPKGSSAGIVCSNHRFIRLRGPVSWLLTEPACNAGKELTPGEYSLIAPRGGRFKVIEGLLVVEREMRGGEEEDPQAPIVVRPRNTILRSNRPTVSWSRVATATAYEVRWSGPGTISYSIRVQAKEISCTEELDGLVICSLRWPEGRPVLPPGEIFFLRIAARSGSSGHWHSNDPVEARTQEIPRAGEQERQLSDLERLGLEGANLDAARAGLLAAKGLYSDAADLYRRALAAVPAPELLVTLADVELAMGLYFLAEPHYRQALAQPAPSIQAAAAFGLGRITYARHSYHEARKFFEQARELYSQLGLEDEEAASRQAVNQATRYPSRY